MRRRLTVILLLLSLGAAPARPQSSPQLTHSVVAGGGGASAQGPKRVEGTIGQSAAGDSSGGTFTISGGFHPVFAALALPSLTVSDVTRAEGNSGQVPFTFTVTLDSPAPASGVTFNYTAADGTAADSDDDYEPAGGAGSIPAGGTSAEIVVQVNGDTAKEAPETFTVTVSGVTGASAADAHGLGTVLNDDGAPAAGQIVISEFRLRGPVPAGTPVSGNDAGQQDEFIEIYNKSDSDFIVVDSSPRTGLASDGWAIVSSDAPTTAKYVIPVGTRIPARGYFLVANGLGYSLGLHPSGDDGEAPTTAIADANYFADIPDGAGIAIFRTGNPASFGQTNERLDAAGFATGMPFFEGAPLSPAAGLAASTEHSFLRRLAYGTPLDTGDNATDFVLVATDPEATGNNSVLGAPGPQNLTSPAESIAKLKAGLIDPTQPSSAPPNRARDTTPHSCNGGASPSLCAAGTLSIRRRFTNGTGAPLTRLRFRVVEITTLNSPGYAAGGSQADLRVLSSATATVGVTGGGTVQVQGTTLEVPPAQPLGGGLDSTLALGTVTLETPLAAGHSRDVEFRLGVMQPGTFRFFVNVEALPGPVSVTAGAGSRVRPRAVGKR